MHHDVHTAPVISLLTVTVLSPRNNRETDGGACASLLEGAVWCAVVTLLQRMTGYIFASNFLIA